MCSRTPVALRAVVDESRDIEYLEALHDRLEAVPVVGLYSVFEFAGGGVVLSPQIVIRAQLRPQRAAGILEQELVREQLVEHGADCGRALVVASGKVVVDEHLRREYVAEPLLSLLFSFEGWMRGWDARLPEV